MAKRTLTVRGVPDEQLRRLRARASANHRSLNGELLDVLAAAARGGTQPTTSLPVIREAAAARFSASPGGLPSIVSDIDRDALAAICRKHGIRWLALFGSHARLAATAMSDVDVIVDFEPGKTPGFGIVRVAHDLSEVFANRRVDLVTRNGLSPRLRDRILAEAKTLYGA